MSDGGGDCGGDGGGCGHDAGITADPLASTHDVPAIICAADDAGAISLGGTRSFRLRYDPLTGGWLLVEDIPLI